MKFLSGVGEYGIHNVRFQVRFLKQLRDDIRTGIMFFPSENAAVNFLSTNRISERVLEKSSKFPVHMRHQTFTAEGEHYAHAAEFVNNFEIRQCVALTVFPAYDG